MKQPDPIETVIEEWRAVISHAKDKSWTVTVWWATWSTEHPWSVAIGFSCQDNALAWGGQFIRDQLHPTSQA